MGDILMIRLSAFADEIAVDPVEQLNVLEAEEIKALELRSAWGKNVVKFDSQDLKTLKKLFQERGFTVSAIGSPIGKYQITEDFAPHLDDFRRIVEIARFFETKNIRIFSFFIPDAQDAVVYRDEVLRRLRILVDEVKREEIVLLHENEKEIYGDVSDRCLDLFSSIQSSQFRGIIDPANFVQMQEKPFSTCWPKLKNYIDYIHIKDAILATKEVVPAGEGDGEVEPLIKDLAKRGFEGYLSLEPHLNVSHTSIGISGADGFRQTARALKRILERNKIPYC
jgi:3-dehydroshikimate dehydratase